LAFDAEKKRKRPTTQTKGSRSRLRSFCVRSAKQR
jgi:hypothetical protein